MNTGHLLLLSIFLFPSSSLLSSFELATALVGFGGGKADIVMDGVMQKKIVEEGEFEG